MENRGFSMVWRGMTRRRALRGGLLAAVWLAMAGCVSGEVILQYFVTEWEEIYRRMPEIGEIGYDGMWIPSPCKSPVAGDQKFSNVGYSLYDRWDLGEIPQRGTRHTRYGTRGDLRRMVDNAHFNDVKIYPDVVFNHNGNGPDFRTYPGMRANDFHGHWDGSQPGGFRRAPRMSSYDDIGAGFGGTFKEELVSLIDVITERDQRFNYNPFTATPDRFVRHPGRYDKYPSKNPGDTLPDEYPWEMLDRWTHWLGDAMDYDGFRLDAAKHVIREFYGPRSSGFLYEAQKDYDQRRGNTSDDAVPTMYQNEVRRTDMLMFAEIFTGSSSVFDYWRNGDVRMRYLDFPLKQSVVGNAFSSGNLAALGSIGVGLDPTEGVMFVQSHDQRGPDKLDLAYAYLLTHVGIPVVYFTGNNLTSSDHNTRTWVLQGHDAALSDHHNRIANLVYIHNHFARGREWSRHPYDNDLWIHERYQDQNADQDPDTGEGLLLVGLNDSGVPRSSTVDCAFQDGTVLHDYTGNNPIDVPVIGGQALIEVPPGPNNQGYVCYAPLNATANGVPLRFNVGGSPEPEMDWIVPGGMHAIDKARTIPRLTGNTVDIDVHFNNPAGGAVSDVVVKWGQGRDLNPGATDFGGSDVVKGGYEQATEVSPGHWRLTADLTGVPDGLHLVRARCFNDVFPLPAIYQTFSRAVYVDRNGPVVDIVTPTASEVIPSECIAEIRNPDYSAWSMTVSLDGGTADSAHEVTRGHWISSLSGLSAGAHTMAVTTVEADWGSPRWPINTSVVTRVFSAAATAGAIDMNHGEGDVIEVPFFNTAISNVPGGASVTLRWDGYRQVGLTETSPGTWEHTFDGRYISGGVEDRLWGAFVNGPHWFEAEILNGSVTTRISRQVFFDLYGSGVVDSDGDGLPDDVERPGFIAMDSSLDGVSPNAAWPGDDNQDMIPNYGEFWTRLNPLNHNTDYTGNWDGDEDWDGDGYPNLCEVWKGYFETGNPFQYDIYDSGSQPPDCVFTNGGMTINPVITLDPVHPNNCAGSTLTITYEPNEGPLAFDSPIHLGITGHGVSPMTDIGGGAWQTIHAIPGGAVDVVYWFQDAGGTNFDNNGGANYSVPVSGCVVQTNYFVMDGVEDSANYVVSSSTMKVVAARKGSHLYLATWSANGDVNDHFILVTDSFADGEPAPWAKNGEVFFDKTTKPWIAAESDPIDGFHAINNGGANGRAEMGANGQVLEAEIDLAEVFGGVPELLYVAAVAYGDGDGSGILSQGPGTWESANNDVESYEFLPLPTASIVDDDLDGHFDMGRPTLRTVVNGATNDANYDLRRFFIDENAGETNAITVILDPGTDPADTVSDVEVFSNINRRDFAALDEDRGTVTTTTPSTYYRAYTMTPRGDGTYEATLPVTHCGAYRIDARYRVNGGSYVYYTDNGLRRDCAVVVSPRKALEMTMYELNPMIAEAQDSTFLGRSTFADMHLVNTDRPDYLNTQHYLDLGVKIVWLQPIHPIGGDGRQVDPETGVPYDPASPYAVRNYWKVNSILGDPSTEAEAMAEFQGFVAALDDNGVGVMLDGTFNHSAWDCEIGDVGVDMFAWATNANDFIRDNRPQWYSARNDYRQRASYYNSTLDTDIAAAPDRTDFGKWTDAADFNFGAYDALVGEQGNAHRSNFLFERDWFAGHDTFSREIWEYFAFYPAYWLEKTGHPVGTPKSESHKGIDGLRCDFAQGLPSAFWEYTINRTRSVKWDFLFMAESLDGFREVNGSKKHGIGYRSARHFDILNENLLFTWRDEFFNYLGSPPSPNRTTGLIQGKLDDRREAYAVCPLLLNLTSHDEILPSDNHFGLFYAYASLAVMDGVPMIMYGQEAGAQNDINTYGPAHPGINAIYNFSKYELNFGKAIPNFKRYNNLASIWDSRGANGNLGWNLQDAYGRANRARCGSQALRSQFNFFLNLQGGGTDPGIFAVAKFEEPGVSASLQDVVLCFINNDIDASVNRTGTFKLDEPFDGGGNWFGIDPAHNYNLVDLLSTNPTAEILPGDVNGAALISGGYTVDLNGSVVAGEQAAFLRLMDKTAPRTDWDMDGLFDYGDPDDDNDGLSDEYETANSLDPHDATGTNGPDGDPDSDGATTYEEMLAGTNPRDGNDVLAITAIRRLGPNTEVDWNTVKGKNYRIESTEDLRGGTWRTTFFGTAGDTSSTVIESTPTEVPASSYRAVVKP